MGACIHCGGALDTHVRVCPVCRTLQPVAGQRGPIGPGVTLDLGYGRLVVQARIGGGGMGAVYRAWLFFPPDRPGGEVAPMPLALKVLHARAEGTPKLRGMFAKEADALRSLQHPNIVRFHDFFEWGGPLALAMELVEGSTLEEVIARNRARARLAGSPTRLGLSNGRAWYYFQQLLGALAATHAIGIVHRDVKPSNVLVRVDGVVKLGDFGIARLVRERSDPPSSALYTSIGLGTSAYMSPEQVVGGAIDERSDVYSAAIVFYEMLAGRPPFATDERSEFMVRQDQVEAVPPPLRAFVSDAPRRLDDLLARALAKNPADRFSSALEFGDSIRTALGEDETAEWRAQREFASRAPLSVRSAARDPRLEQIHDEVLEGYRSSSRSRSN